jgi:protein tyrosine/serine phosphatase
MFFPLLLLGQSAVKIESIGLEKMYKIDNGVYRSEQPDTDHFILLEKYGIGEILNLRYWHSDKDETSKTALIAHRVRMNAHNINNSDVIDALKIIKNRQHPILIHCRHGSDRTGVIAAMYRIVFQNWTKDDAIAEMVSDKFGFHSIYNNIIKYIKNADIEQIKLDLKIK